MAQYKIPYQNLTYQIPDEGRIYRTDPTQTAINDRRLIMRKGGSFVVMDGKEYKGDYNSLPILTITGEMEKAMDSMRAGLGGERIIQGTVNDFTNVTPKTGEVITQNISPSNPNAPVISSNIQGVILGEQAPSALAQQAKQAGVQFGQSNAGSGGIQPPTSTLQPGATGDEVKKLQDYLVSQGLMTQQQVNTGYGIYGPQTTAAVKALQDRLGVDNASGAGYFGPKTISAINNSVGAGAGTTTTGGGIGSGVGALPDTPHPNDALLEEMLQSQGLSDDQKDMIRTYFKTVSQNDLEQYNRMIKAFDFATSYSDPIFKAQVAIVKSALDEGLKAISGDLEYKQTSLKKQLADLEANIGAENQYLDLNSQQEINNLRKKLQLDLESNAQNMAATGRTSSSVRTQAEGLLKEGTEGLIESKERTLGYQKGQNQRQLTQSQESVAAQLANIQSESTQKRLELLRQAEQQLGTTGLSQLQSQFGFNQSELLGNIPSEIERKKKESAMSFATNSGFVF